jgi:hypothetical protein
MKSRRGEACLALVGETTRRGEACLALTWMTPQKEVC